MEASAGSPSELHADSVPLEHGIELRCAMHALDGSVEIGLAHKDRHLTAAVLHPAAPDRTFRVETHPLDVELDVHVDHFTGEVTATGHLTILGHSLIRLDKRVLARFSPCSGSVGKSSVPDPPLVKDATFGGSRPYASHVTRIFVDEEPRLLTPVGALVKRRRFSNDPPFVFNTVSCIGADDPAGAPCYADPRSRWFNVFVGYYQIDAPKCDWRRPFGYTSPEGSRSCVEFRDLLALGKSDWNWFANWMYGVPEDLAEQYSEADEDAQLDQSAAGRIGESLWHLVSVGNLQFVSAYESAAPDAARLQHNSLLSGVWRRCYGAPCPCPGFAESFIPTTMNTQIQMAYWEDDEAFHTTMFGGSARTSTDQGFLECQLAAVRAVIERTHPALGFPLDGS
jgi:hypothetical protein